MPESIFFSAIILASGFLQGLTGFGFALIALPLLNLFIPFKTIIPLICLLALCINITLSVQLHRHVDYRKFALLLAATIPTVFLGVFLLKHVQPRYLSLALATLMISFTSHQLLTRPACRPLGTRWTLAAGFLSGLLAGSIGAGGPPVIVYSTLCPWDKDRAKGTLALYFLISGTFVTLIQTTSGFMTGTVLHLFLVALPALAVGLIGGALTYRRISDSNYRRLALVVVLLLGVFMLSRNL